MRKHFGLIVLVVVAAIGSVTMYMCTPDIHGEVASRESCDCANKVERTQAAEAAYRWLDSLDAGDYSTAYTQLYAPEMAFADAAAFEAHRKPGGAILDRRLNRSVYYKFSETLPDTPSVTLRFQSRFRDAGEREEVVIVAKQGDAWVVAGYELK